MLANRLQTRSNFPEQGGGENFEYSFDTTDGWEYNGWITDGYRDWVTLSRIRNPTFFPFEGTNYECLSIGRGAGIRIFFYNGDKETISYQESKYNLNLSGVVPIGTRYIRVSLVDINFKDIPSLDWLLQYELVVRISE